MVRLCSGGEGVSLCLALARRGSPDAVRALAASVSACFSRGPLLPGSPLGPRMDRLRGVADVIEHLLYETLGLLVPGAVLLFAGAAAVGPDAWAEVTRFFEGHAVLAVVVVYLLGYPLQAVSRPIIGIADAVLSLPGRALRRLPRLADWMARAEVVLGARHRRVPDESWQRGQGDRAADLNAIAARYWTERLAIPADQRLTPHQVVDLSFSRLLGQRQQLDRFRAAASLCRATAAALIIVAGVLALQIAADRHAPSVGSFALLGLLVVLFYGFLERADMYADLWRSVVTAQFLSTVTASEPLRGARDGGPDGVQRPDAVQDL